MSRGVPRAVHRTADPVPQAVQPAGLQAFHPEAGRQADPVVVLHVVPVAVRHVVLAGEDDEQCF